MNNEFIGTHRSLGDTGGYPNIITHKLVKNNYANAVMINVH